MEWEFVISGEERVGRCNKKCCSKNFPTKRDAVCSECVQTPLYCLIHFSWCGEASLHFPVNLIHWRLLWFHCTGGLTKSQWIYVRVESTASLSAENLLLKETVWSDCQIHLNVATGSSKLPLGDKSTYTSIHMRLDLSNSLVGARKAVGKLFDGKNYFPFEGFMPLRNAPI